MLRSFIGLSKLSTLVKLQPIQATKIYERRLTTELAQAVVNVRKGWTGFELPSKSGAFWKWFWRYQGPPEGRDEPRPSPAHLLLTRLQP